MRHAPAVLAAFLLCCAGTWRDARAELDVEAQARSATWLSKRRAAQVIAESQSIGEEVLQELSNVTDPNEAAILEDVQDALPHPSEWRWYSRDRGLLVAMSARQRLGITTSSVGKDALEAITRRVLEQHGYGRPDVRVVFIEPDYPPRSRGRFGGGLGDAGAGGAGLGGGSWDQGTGCGCW